MPTPKAGLRSGGFPTRRPEVYASGLRNTGRRAISIMVSAIEGLQAKEQEADGIVASLGERVRGDFPILDQVRLSGVGMLRCVLVLGVVVRVMLECGPQFAYALVSYANMHMKNVMVGHNPRTRLTAMTTPTILHYMQIQHELYTCMMLLYSQVSVVSEPTASGRQEQNSYCTDMKNGFSRAVLFLWCNGQDNRPIPSFAVLRCTRTMIYILSVVSC